MLAQKSKSGAIAKLALNALGPGNELTPLRVAPVDLEGQGAIRIVQLKNRRLMISASTAQAPRMLRVTFNLDRARIVGLHHESLSSAAQRHDRVVVDGLAVD